MHIKEAKVLTNGEKLAGVSADELDLTVTVEAFFYRPQGQSKKD